MDSRVSIERSRQGLSENMRFIAVTQTVLEIFLKNRQNQAFFGLAQLLHPYASILFALQVLIW